MILSPREQSIFTCVADTVVAPADGMPEVRDSDALVALDEHLRAAPPLNRVALRVMLLTVEVAPRLIGSGARLRRLDGRAARGRALDRLRRHPATAPLVKALQATAHMAYYGDDRVMKRLGYDADAIVARAAALRAQEGRW